MRGDNPKRSVLKGDGTTLEVKEIFFTLQGEGTRALQPAVFIRLGGCNLSCSFCDTEFEGFDEQPLEDIIAEVENLSIGAQRRRANLIVITGGEPLRQPIEPLCDRLIALGFTVQIETNGSLYRNLHENVEIICSPKIVKDGKYHIHKSLLPHITAFKYMFSETSQKFNVIYDVQGAQEVDISAVPIYIQPIDEGDAHKNARNTQLALDMCMREGYRLSLQQHKMLDLP